MSDSEFSMDIGGADIQCASELADCKVVFTGRLAEATRADVKDLVERNGGKVTNNISGQSDLLVVGDNPGSEKIEFLETHGTPTLTEHEFYALFPDRFELGEGVSGDSVNQATLSEQDGEPLQLHLRPIVAYLVESRAEQQGDELDSVVTDSTRRLLKEVIDGGQISVTSPSATTTVSVQLPPNLLRMVETAVETTSGIATRAEFVQAAIRHDVGFGADAEHQTSLSLQLPSSVITELEALSDHDDCEVGDVASELLVAGLEQRVVTD